MRDHETFEIEARSLHAHGVIMSPKCRRMVKDGSHFYLIYWATDIERSAIRKWLKVKGLPFFMANRLHALSASFEMCLHPSLRNAFMRLLARLRREYVTLDWSSDVKQFLPLLGTCKYRFVKSHFDRYVIRIRKGPEAVMLKMVLS